MWMADNLMNKNGFWWYRKVIPAALREAAGRHWSYMHPKTGQPYLGERIWPSGIAVVAGTGRLAEAQRKAARRAAKDFADETEQWLEAAYRSKMLGDINMAYSGQPVTATREVRTNMRA